MAGDPSPDSAGDVGFSSPVVFQMDNDPEDEVPADQFSSGKGLDYETRRNNWSFMTFRDLIKLLSILYWNLKT